VRRRAQGTALSVGQRPNELWCTDYKGEFLLGNRQYYYPLTPSPGKNRGVLSRMDQEQAGAAAISCAGSGKGADGNVVGLPHIQPAALDPPKQAPRNTSCHVRE